MFFMTPAEGPTPPLPLVTVQFCGTAAVWDMTVTAYIEPD